METNSKVAQAGVNTVVTPNSFDYLITENAPYSKPIANADGTRSIVVMGLFKGLRTSLGNADYAGRELAKFALPGLAASIEVPLTKDCSTTSDKLAQMFDNDPFANLPCKIQITVYEQGQIINGQATTNGGRYAKIDTISHEEYADFKAKVLAIQDDLLA